MPTDNELQQMKAIRWYHSMRFGDVVTQGESYPAVQEWRASAIPERLDALSVLDIGAWDGYYSFLAESRGARRVLGIDSLQEGRHKEVGTRGFEFAKAYYKSNVEYRVMDVLDLEQIRETFDVVLFLGVYYHLDDPILALKKLHAVVKPGGFVLVEGPLLPGREPTLRFYSPHEIEPTTYSAATLPWFERVARHIGFSRVTLVSGTWQMPVGLRISRARGTSLFYSICLAVAKWIRWRLRMPKKLESRAILRLDK